MWMKLASATTVTQFGGRYLRQFCLAKTAQILPIKRKLHKLNMPYEISRASPVCTG